MNQASIQSNWESFRRTVGIGLRAVAALPEDSLDKHPVPNMRTPKELVVHMFTMVREFPAGVRAGTLESFDEDAIPGGLATRADLLAYCNKAWADGDAIAPRLTDAQIGATVKTPWGEFPGFALMQILGEEFLHHRGQLYVYQRALGVEGPMIYDFENNEAAFQPKAPAKA
jgi:uncharacterized damage-inducible protein DinB